MAPKNGGFASALTLSAVSLAFRAFIKPTTKSWDVRGLPVLLDALKIPHYAPEDAAGNEAQMQGKGKGKMRDYTEEEQQNRRGVITVCNHISVLDDPTMFTSMPLSAVMPFAGPSRVCRRTRWTLGAADIMFTNPVFSRFFTLGQTIETFRGRGIFQPAVDKAVKLLQDGEWIHIFPEGRVNQPKLNPRGGMFRWKWGVGRILMDSKVMPEVIPMWISGFDQIMPETRKWPRFVPRAGAKITITIGQPINHLLQPLIDEWRDIAACSSETLGVGGEWRSSSDEKGGDEIQGANQRTVREEGRLADGRERDIRMKLTAVMQEQVRKLGEQVEEEEGKFGRGEWTQSRVYDPAAPIKPPG